MRLLTRFVLAVFFLFTLFCGASILVFGQCPSAQQTTVTFTLTDSDSIAWANAKVTANLYNPSQTQRPLCASTNQPFPIQVSAVANGSGAVSMVLTGNSAITPPGTRWIFTLQSDTSAPPTISTQLLIQTGGTQNLTSTLNAQLVAPRFQTGVFGAYGYNVVEALPNPCLNGDAWLNITTNQQLVCNGGSFVPPTPPATLQIQTNSVNNTLQTILNLESAAGITVANPSGGVDTFACDIISASQFGCGTVDNSTIQANGSGQLSIKNVPASLLTNLFGDGYIVIQPNTPSTGDTTIAHQNLDQLNTGNVHTVGNQIVESGSPITVAMVTQGKGVLNPGYLDSQVSNSRCTTETVAVGNTYLFTSAFNNAGGSTTASSTLGNTVTLVTQFSPFPGPNPSLYVFISHVTHAGSDTVCAASITGPSRIDLFSNVTGVDAGAITAQTQAPSNVTVGPLSVTTSAANDMLLEIDINNGGTGCTIGLPTSGFAANNNNGLTSGVYNFGGHVLSDAPGTYSVSWADSGCSNSSSSSYQMFVALEGGGTFIQSADLHDYENASNTKLSGVDANGFFNPPQSAGLPVSTPAPGSIVYDTTHNKAAYYNTSNGWTDLCDTFNGCSSGNTLTQQVQLTTGFCTLTNGAYDQCTDATPRTWPVAFADTNYSIVCSSGTLPVPGAGAGAITQIGWTNKTTTGFELQLQNGDGNGANPTVPNEIDCVGVHP